MKKADSQAWTRAIPQAAGPNRSFGGYYRGSDRVLNGKLFRGVPLQTAEDAVVAAVRLGYRVVDAQIERGMGIARNLRGAAESTGSGDPRQMVESAEQLISKALLAGLQWFEEAATDSGHPIRRLLGAEYRMLGSMFGLATGTARRQGAAEAPAEPESAPVPARRARDSQVLPRVRIRLPEGKRVEECRPIRRIVTWQLDRPLTDEALPLLFRRVSRTPAMSALDEHVMRGSVLRRDSKVMLELDADAKLAAGIWRAGIFDESDLEQIGLVEVEL